MDVWHAYVPGNEVGQDGGSDGVDQNLRTSFVDGFGAFLLGRMMFGPIRGPGPDVSWKGGWGDNPPYHAPTAGNADPPSAGSR